ncbi:MAG: FkbM family methyltransferase, partial [Gammaproteobacteria bacterium]|nr:FkbM family methyltransferase [Gammaproteobacteria bacterium]NIR27832.1 FkbM family methyltransferase [Gammaproteobacteria bacterium]NIR81691.1 FkbM family methyltransferase [Gammaproteobacteria bacterium]NIU03253.1 FkbM family methyltransferase [Gammaproteobacteria bacterium]NIV50315.1 FkbM family methyltransferase [Gammaproteobacteria bacterium]
RLVQPVFVDDVVAALVAALWRREARGGTIVVAGPQPMTYAHMVRACARALGRRVVIVPVPTALLTAGARLAGAVGAPFPLDEAEIARAGEDKAFDVGDMRERLGVEPRPFEEGLRLALERRAACNASAFA